MNYFQKTGSSMQEEVETSMYDAVAGITKCLKLHVNGSFYASSACLIKALNCRIWLSRECVCRGRRRNEHLLFVWSL